MSNQVLAPVPVGTCPPGTASTLNLAGIAGDQFFGVCPTATGVPDGSDAGFGLALAAANPLRGDRLRVTFSLPDARPARLALIDAAGRVRREMGVGGGAGRALVADLSAGRRLAPGVYWIRLTQGDAVATRKVSVVW